MSTYRPEKPTSSQSSAAAAGRGRKQTTLVSSRSFNTSHSQFQQPYASKPHPNVQFVAQPVTENRLLVESLSGVIVTDTQYHNSLKRLLGFHKHRLDARTIPVRHEVNETQPIKLDEIGGESGSPTRISVVVAGKKQQRHEILDEDFVVATSPKGVLLARKDSPCSNDGSGGNSPLTQRGSGNNSPATSRPGTGGSIPTTDRIQRTASYTSRATAEGQPPRHPKATQQPHEPMTFDTKSQLMGSYQLGSRSTPSVSHATASQRKQHRGGRLHWTQLSLHDFVDEDERTFSWAVDCAKGIYHNRSLTDSGKAKPLPPRIKLLVEKQRKDEKKPPELMNTAAVTITTRLYDNSKAVKLSQEIAPPVRREQIGNWRSYKESLKAGADYSEIMSQSFTSPVRTFRQNTPRSGRRQTKPSPSQKQEREKGEETNEDLPC